MTAGCTTRQPRATPRPNRFCDHAEHEGSRHVDDDEELPHGLHRARMVGELVVGSRQSERMMRCARHAEHEERGARRDDAPGREHRGEAEHGQCRAGEENAPPREAWGHALRDGGTQDGARREGRGDGRRHGCKRGAIVLQPERRQRDHELVQERAGGGRDEPYPQARETDRASHRRAQRVGRRLGIPGSVLRPPRFA